MDRSVDTHDREVIPLCQLAYSSQADTSTQINAIWYMGYFPVPYMPPYLNSEIRWGIGF